MTRSAVSEGQLIIRDKVHQQQDIDDLSRDTANAHEKQDPILDKEKEQLVGELGKQITNITVTDATIAATKKVNEQRSTLSGKAREELIQAAS